MTCYSEQTHNLCKIIDIVKEDNPTYIKGNCIFISVQESSKFNMDFVLIIILPLLFLAYIIFKQIHISLWVDFYGLLFLTWILEKVMGAILVHIF